MDSMAQYVSLPARKLNTHQRGEAKMSIVTLIIFVYCFKFLLSCR